MTPRITIFLLIALSLTGCGGRNWIEQGSIMPPMPAVVASPKPIVVSPKGAVASSVSSDMVASPPAPIVTNCLLQFAQPLPLDLAVSGSPDVTVTLANWWPLGTLAAGQTNFYFSTTNQNQFFVTWRFL